MQIKLSAILTISLLGFLSTCNPDDLKVKKPSYRTDIPAKIRMIVEPVDGAAIDEVQFDEAFGRLKQRAEETETVFHKIYTNKEKNQVIFDIIETPDIEGFRRMITKSGKLEFWNIYRGTDPVIANALIKIDKAQDLFPFIESYSNYAIGIVAPENIEKVMSILETEKAKELLPDDVLFLWSKYTASIAYPAGKEKIRYTLYAIKTNNEPAPVSGLDVASSKAGINEQMGVPEIHLVFDAAGAKKWAQVTTAAARDDNREVAIVIDGKVYSSPRVISPIMSGRASISGSFRIEEATILANKIGRGALPFDFKIISEDKL